MVCEALLASAEVALMASFMTWISSSAVLAEYSVAQAEAPGNWQIKSSSISANVYFTQEREVLIEINPNL